MLAMGGELGGITHEGLARMMQQEIANTNFLFTFIWWLIGASFLFTIGCYAYTWTTSLHLWRKLDELLNNHISHLQARIKSLEETRQSTRDGDNDDGLL